MPFSAVARALFLASEFIVDPKYSVGAGIKKTYLEKLTP
jgi:hypothetical protein